MDHTRISESANDVAMLHVSFSEDKDTDYIDDQYNMDDDDVFSYVDVDEYRRKSCKEKMGECLVRVGCTSTVGLVLSLCVLIAAVGVVKVTVAVLFWRQCPLAPCLPLFLLLSGLVPTLFYLTCRTRRKKKGAVSAKQRIMGRWEFSLLHFTFDMERSWQAGLATVVSLFLLVWLCIGTAVTVLTIQKVNAAPSDCSLAVSALHHNASVRSSSSSASMSLLSLLSSSNSSVKFQHTSSSSSSPPKIMSGVSEMSEKYSDSTATARLSSSSQPLQLNRLEDSNTRREDASHQKTSSGSLPVLNGVTVGQHTPQMDASLKTNRTVNHQPSHEINTHNLNHTQYAAFNSQISKNSTSYNDISDVSVEETSSETREECQFCDMRFLKLCFGLVLFDWAYVAAFLLNLLIVATVPCCCFSNIESHV